MIDNYPELNDFIKRQNLKTKVLKLKDYNEVYKVKLAELKELESFKKAKDFTFEFISNKYYYIFITIEENPDFCKKIEKFNHSQTHVIKYQTYQTTTNDQNSFFNFDYRKYLININIYHKESDVESFKRIPLNREHTIISHSTYDTITYYKKKKNLLTKETSTHNIDQFVDMLQYFFIIEIENLKYE